MESAKQKSPLHSHKFVHGKGFKHAFTFLYGLAILALFYHHINNILTHYNCSFFISFSIFIADLILALIWCTTTPFHMSPIIVRRVFPENVEKVADNKEFSALDVFIFTADPFKEPPLCVLNTALSVMAYDYPTDKISVYVSDDGGSQLTLFALMEAVDFAKQWLPFCKQNNIIQRSPDAYFGSNYNIASSEHHKIKMMYERMKIRIQNVIEEGKIIEEYITSEQQRQVFKKWSQEFTGQEHPSIIQVLLEAGKSKDIVGNSMPNLVYVSREKSKKCSHHYKAGAQNVLLRVSAIMSNAPIILTLDCDMYSNDPLTPHRMLCFLMEDSETLSNIQFPQRFYGLNNTDIYASEMKRMFTVCPMVMDGLKGPQFVGTGCFFRRRAFFGSPLIQPHKILQELENLNYTVINKPISSKETLILAHHVSACNYEHRTDWGSKLGFRYGSLVEDFFTSYSLHCEGWKSVFCNPERPAFLGKTPITLNDVLVQNKRWAFGLLEVAFSKYSPMTFGVKSMAGPLMALAYAHFAFGPLLCISITIYTYLPQLTLLNKTPIFPKVGDPEFFLYAFLFLGSYVQDCIGFVFTQSTFRKWWNDQRIWLMRGLSSYLFGTFDYVSKRLGIFPTTPEEFNVTNKAVDNDNGYRKRYDEGKFEFGNYNQFVPLAVAALINLTAFIFGFLEIIPILVNGGNNWGEIFFSQMFVTGFGVLNSIPIYEAMFFRYDNGRMSTRTTVTSILLASLIIFVACS